MPAQQYRTDELLYKYRNDSALVTTLHALIKEDNAIPSAAINKMVAFDSAWRRKLEVWSAV